MGSGDEVRRGDEHRGKEIEREEGKEYEVSRGKGEDM